MGHIGRNICAQKLHFFWTFLTKSEQNRRNSYFFGENHAKNRTLHASSLAQKLQKIELFSGFTIQLHCKWLKIWDISGTYADPFVHKNCKKLNFFWEILGKSAYFLGNSHFLLNFGAENGTYTGSLQKRNWQKIAKNWTFFGVSNTNSIENRWKMADIWDISRISHVHKNCTFFQKFQRKVRIS